MKLNPVSILYRLCELKTVIRIISIFGSLTLSEKIHYYCKYNNDKKNRIANTCKQHTVKTNTIFIRILLS